MVVPYNVETYRAHARRRIPRPVFDFVDGAAEDEVTARANEAAFRAVQLVPRVLRHVAAPDLSTSVCGIELDVPIVTAPTGFTGVVHPDGELAAALAAPRVGGAALISSAATYSLEELGQHCAVPPWFQLYPPRDRELGAALISRAGAIGVPLLAVTVDVPVPGKRERDLANSYTITPRLTPQNAMSVVAHPGWTLRLLRNPRIYTKNLTGGTERLRYRDAVRLLRESLGVMSPRVDWDDLAWIREQWSGKLVVKGILHPDDARRAVDLGVDAVIVSNHGGRQLDGVPAALEVLPAVVAAAGSDTEVLVDGGVRRGSDIAKALCLGARACLVGRPWVYGLAAGGTNGVEGVLRVLREELTRTLVLLGCAGVRELSGDYLWSGQRPRQRT